MYNSSIASIMCMHCRKKRTLSQRGLEVGYRLISVLFLASSSRSKNVLWDKWFDFRGLPHNHLPVPLFSCDQAALWMVQSVCPSVCPSVRPSVRPSVTPFWLCSHHPVIMKFSGVITSDKSDVHAKGQGQRSKVKVTEVTTQLNRFRTVTPV